MFILDALGTLLRIILDVLLIPFRGLPPFWGLLFISMLAGLGMIQVFGRVSDQNAISRLRKRMTGEVLGILLHVSRPGTVMRFAGKLIVSNFVYLWHILKPLLVLAVLRTALGTAGGQICHGHSHGGDEPRYRDPLLR